MNQETKFKRIVMDLHLKNGEIIKDIEEAQIRIKILNERAKRLFYLKE